MLRLRLIEVIRAILVTGTVGGAAWLLNVSSPGISRVMKPAEAIAAITFAVTAVWAWSAREACRAPLNDLGEVDAAPVGEEVYDRMRAATYDDAKWRRA